MGFRRGATSLFWFLVRELGLSKGSAYLRMTAAGLVQRFPEVVEPLRDGGLCVSSVGALAKVLTPENRTEVLARFFHRSKQEAAEIVAELRPVAEPPRRAVVTVMRSTPVREMSTPSVPAAARDAGVTDVPGLGSASAQPGFPENLVHAKTSSEARGSLPRPEARPAAVEPLTADLVRYHVTVSKRFLAKLEAARDALSHAMPAATPEQLLEAGLDLLLEKDAKRKGLVAKPRETLRPSTTDQPRETLRPSTTDRVPAHVRRAVFQRDGGRCQVPLASGETCGSTYRVQLGHIVPRAKGGPPTVENLHCECETHNQRQADRDFGEEFMARIRRRRARTG